MTPGEQLGAQQWEAVQQVFDPGSTPESRESVRVLRDGQELMARYEGGPGTIEFDGGGRPYYQRDHFLPGGEPSGWQARHYGGPIAEVYHQATGDTGHDLVRLPLHPDDEAEMVPRLHPDFGDADLATHLRDWHDDAEGGARVILEKDNPRVGQWKARHHGPVRRAADYAPPAGRLRKEELILAVREYALHHYGDPGHAWSEVADSWDAARIWAVVAGTATLAGARKKIEPLIAIPGDEVSPGETPAEGA